MATTFTPVTLNLGGNAVPLPGVATMTTGGVTGPVPASSNSFTFNPIAPLPTGPGVNSTAI